MIKNFRHIFLPLAVALLAACHDGDIQQKVDDNLQDPNGLISFTTRAVMDNDNWMLEPLPGMSANTVVKDGVVYDVPNNIGVFGFFTEENTETPSSPKVKSLDAPVFGIVKKDADNITITSDVVEEYDTPTIGEGNLSEDSIQNYRERIFDQQEDENNPGIGEKQSDGLYHFPNGAVEDSLGTVIKKPTDPDNPDNPVVTDPPYGIMIAGDGTVEFRDGTKITADYVYKKYRYVGKLETSGDTYEVPVLFQIFRNGGDDRYKILYDGEVTEGTTYPDILSADVLGITETTDNDGKITITFPDGTVVTREKDVTQQGESADGSPITSPTTTTHTTTIVFPMKWYDETQQEHIITVTLDCIAKTLTFVNGNDRTVLNLNDIQKTGNQTSGGGTTSEGTQSPARKRTSTRATTNYDDENDKYYYGYERQRWQNEDYMFYGYSPASRNATINIDGEGNVGSFTWDKIPCVSTTDYVVAKEEVWRKNKSGVTSDFSRIHFDDMQHLMSRVRLYFAVHPDFHKIRRVVVVKASLSFVEDGFRKVYKFENKRSDENKHGKETWKWTVNPDYIYNPKYNTSYYSYSKDGAHPSDMVAYQNRADANSTERYGKVLKTLKDDKWSNDYLFTDFYIVPFKDNAAATMTLHVKYNIYDTDPDDKHIKTSDGRLRLFPNDCLLRECERESTIEFKVPMKFEPGVSHALKIMINPDYIYNLSDHDEPADMIVK